jgi:Zn ribbon nucleic-acid-binding protein
MTQLTGVAMKQIFDFAVRLLVGAVCPASPKQIHILYWEKKSKLIV